MAMIEKIVDKMVGELEIQLNEKKVSINLSAKARSLLAKKGYNSDYGARPLQRLILREIGDVLTEEILFGKLSKGGKALVDAKDKNLVFSYKSR
jgi:ATP-dependent Clp protease ATP-binding subunit ClpA